MLVLDFLVHRSEVDWYSLSWQWCWL